MKISTGSHTKHVINTTAVFSCKNFGRDGNTKLLCCANVLPCCECLELSDSNTALRETLFRSSDDYNVFSVEVECRGETDPKGIPTPTFDTVVWPTCKEGVYNRRFFLSTKDN